MATTNLDVPIVIADGRSQGEDMRRYFELLNDFDIKKVADLIWDKIAELDAVIQKEEPFKVVKTNPEQGKEIISSLVVRLYLIACMLESLLPETSRKIKEAVKNNTMPENLFARKD